MRNIILMMSVSLDGFIEGPDRELDWHMVDDELHSHFNEQLSQMGAFLNGRVTYELMAEFWPTADTDPSSTGPMVEYARIWREMPKIVYSRTLERADWNTTVVRDVVAEEVIELKAQPGGDPGARRGRPRRSLHGARPDRRVPALRPPDRHWTGQTLVPAIRQEDRPPARRDPDLRQRGRPPPLPAL